jgi:hypothetical protein
MIKTADAIEKGGLARAAGTINYTYGTFGNGQVNAI